MSEPVGVPVVTTVPQLMFVVQEQNFVWVWNLVADIEGGT
jgi:hypothetical protein